MLKCFWILWNTTVSDFIYLFIYLTNRTKDLQVSDMSQRLLMLSDKNIH